MSDISPHANEWAASVNNAFAHWLTGMGRIKQRKYEFDENQLSQLKREIQDSGIDMSDLNGQLSTPEQIKLLKGKYPTAVQTQQQRRSAQTAARIMEALGTDPQFLASQYPELPSDPKQLSAFLKEQPIANLIGIEEEMKQKKAAYGAQTGRTYEAYRKRVSEKDIRNADTTAYELQSMLSDIEADVARGYMSKESAQAVKSLIESNLKRLTFSGELPEDIKERIGLQTGVLKPEARSVIPGAGVTFKVSRTGGGIMEHYNRPFPPPRPEKPQKETLAEKKEKNKAALLKAFSPGQADGSSKSYSKEVIDRLPKGRDARIEELKKKRGY